MGLIHSIEPLTSDQIRKIESETDAKVVVLDRSTLFELDYDFSIVSTLICRDRDRVSQILDICPNLKFVFIISAGVEKLPFEKLKEKNIIVANTSGLNAGIMSEYAIAAVLSQSARIYENYTNQLKHNWKRYQCVDSLENQTLLIVGAGHTGKLIAQKAHVFGMKCLGIKNTVAHLENFEEVGSLQNLDEFLPKADFVICCIPLTPETQSIFSFGRFSKMKSSAVFINISRGGIVVQNDLVRALNEKVISAAILDVFETEPLNSDSPLWDIPNLYISPHSSGRLVNYIDHTMEYFISNYKSVIYGGVFRLI